MPERFIIDLRTSGEGNLIRIDSAGTLQRTDFRPHHNQKCSLVFLLARHWFKSQSHPVPAVQGWPVIMNNLTTHTGWFHRALGIEAITNITPDGENAVEGTIIKIVDGTNKELDELESLPELQWQDVRVGLVKLARKVDGWQIDRDSGQHEYKNRQPHSHLPPISGLLAGRREIIESLNKAYADPGTYCFCLHGFGGIGKTAILYKWFTDLVLDKKHQCDGMFAWSFDVVSSPVKCLAALSHYFGFELDDRKARDAGMAAYEHISRERAIVVLDGLERVWAPRSDGHQSQNEWLDAFITHMSTGANKGLLVLSTRSLDPRMKGVASVKLQEVGELDQPDRVKLLTQENSVEPAVAETIAENCGGYPLLLRLISRNAAMAQHFNDIPIMGDVAEQLDRILDKYFQDELGELDGLVLMVSSIFSDTRVQLLEEIWMNEDIWMDTEVGRIWVDCPVDVEGVETQLDNLQQIGLMEVSPSIAGSLMFSFTHRLIQEACSKRLKKACNKRLRKGARSFWTSAHGWLFSRLAPNPPAGNDVSNVRTSADLERATRAIVHGCQTQMFKEAYDILLRDVLQVKEDEEDGRYFASDDMGQWDDLLRALRAAPPGTGIAPHNWPFSLGK